MCAKPYLFVGIERNTDFAVLYFRMLLKIVDSAYYFGNAGFVVRSEKNTMNLVDRFLQYVKFDTQSDELTNLTPSTPGQMFFAEHFSIILAMSDFT